MKIALITGANKGIGFEIANQLGSRGFHIIASGRNRERIEKAVAKLQSQNISAEALVMDVSDIESIRSAYKKISGSVKSIDVIVNNAGILLDRNNELLDISTKDYLQTFNTNVFGAFFTVQIFFPLLKNGSRVINMSSSGGQILNGISTWSPVYCMSKTALNAVTLQLAEALKSKNIAVNAMSPGWVRTDMGGSSASRGVEKGAETATWLATEAPANLTGKFFMDKEEISW